VSKKSIVRDLRGDVILSVPAKDLASIDSWRRSFASTLRMTCLGLSQNIPRLRQKWHAQNGKSGKIFAIFRRPWGIWSSAVRGRLVKRAPPPVVIDEGHCARIYRGALFGVAVALW